MLDSHNHCVLSHSFKSPFPVGVEVIWLGMGCFWGAEKLFWNEAGVYVTAVGYSAGHTDNPSYQEVCSGQTGHNEVVMVAYDPNVIRIDQLLVTFWENHNPTEGMRQGNDIGTQYRSAIYFTSEAQRIAAEHSLNRYGERLQSEGFGCITTEIQPASAFYYAEDYHQQYLAKNPGGYCGLGGVGVSV